MPNQVYYKKDPNLADLKTNSDTAQERILKANTSYLLNLNNTSGSNNTAVVVLRWHEI